MKLWPKFAEQGYPRAFAASLLIVLLGLFISGALLVPVLLTYRWEMDIPWVPRGSWRVGITAVHGLFGYVLVSLAGAVWLVHARAGLLRRMRHRSGVFLIGTIAVLLVSVPFLLYLSNERALTTAATVHAVVGGMLLIVFLAHFWRRKQ